MTMVSPAMSYFLHKGLANYGYEQASLELLYKKFSKMLSEDSNGTLWEEWWLDGTGRTGKFQGGRTRSDAQTESAFPPDLIAASILGLKVTKPGMKELIISQPTVDLKNIKASLPTPQGNIEIAWNFEKGNSLSLTIPENMIMKVDLDSFNVDGKKEIFLNGQKITETEILELGNGTYKISF